MRGVPRSTLYSLTGEWLARTCSISASSGLPNGTSSFNDWRRKNCVEISKKDSVAILASTILPSGPISITGLGSALRMASPSDGVDLRYSAAGLMQQDSTQNRRTRLRARDAPDA